GDPVFPGLQGVFPQLSPECLANPLPRSGSLVARRRSLERHGGSQHHLPHHRSGRLSRARHKILIRCAFRWLWSAGFSRTNAVCSAAAADASFSPAPIKPWPAVLPPCRAPVATKLDTTNHESNPHLSTRT